MKSVLEAMNGLLQDDSVTEILVDGPDLVYVERQGNLETTDIRFANDQQVIDWANGLLASHGWATVGESRPWAEGRLEYGDRVTVVIPPVAVNGPSVTIRKFTRAPLTFEQLLGWNCLSQNMLDFFKIVMKGFGSILVSGGTSSGKTTLANLLVGLIPPGKRLVAVESAHEFRIDHDRLVYLEAEAAKLSGGEAVDVRQLLRLSSRMRPDWLIVSELRGPEVVDIFDLMNLGHECTLTLIHANSPRDALTRIETMATVAEPSLSLPAIRHKIASGLDLIVQQMRIEDGSRRVVSVTEVQGIKGDNIVLQDLFTWEKTGVDETGRFTGKFKPTGAVPSLSASPAGDRMVFPKGMFGE
jgi:pilus assembly protein CpaF